MRRASSILLVVLLLAGCTSQPKDSEGDDVATGPALIDAEGKQRIDEPPAKETVSTPQGAVAVNKGLLLGRVHDAGNFSISGARVDVLGTLLTGKTDGQGRFRFENVTPGAFDVRVEAPGFTAKEQRVTIKAGQEVAMDIELAIKDGLDPGMAPHIHDNWGTDPTWTLMDHDVPLPERKVALKGQADLLRPNNGVEWPFYLPPQEENKPSTIWPGTKELRFTLSWDTGPENNLPNAGINLQSPLMDTAKPLGFTSNGGTVTYTLQAANETDVGHREWTGWRFWLDVDNSYLNPTAFKPALGNGGVHVKLEIVKGDLVLEVAHRDFWQGNDTLPIGDHARSCTPNAGLPPQESDQTTEQPFYWVCPIFIKEGAVNIVPPGTAKIQVLFSWVSPQGAPVPFTYHLTYRSPDMDPIGTPASAYRTPTVVSKPTSSSILYEIELDSGDVDGFYQPRSGWGFKWHLDNNPGYQMTYIVKFGLQVTAFKDPDY